MTADKKPEPRKAVQYTVLEKSLVGNEMFEAGAIAWYDGLPSENLAPMCDEGRARAAEYVESNRARVAKMQAEHAPMTTDNEAFAKAVGRAIAEANAVHAAQMAELIALLKPAQAPESFA